MVEMGFSPSLKRFIPIAHPGAPADLVAVTQEVFSDTMSQLESGCMLSADVDNNPIVVQVDIPIEELRITATEFMQRLRDYECRDYITSTLLSGEDGTFNILDLAWEDVKYAANDPTMFPMEWICMEGPRQVEHTDMVNLIGLVAWRRQQLVDTSWVWANVVFPGMTAEELKGYLAEPTLVLPEGVENE